MNFKSIKDELKKTLGLLTDENFAADQTNDVKVSDMVVGGKVEAISASGALAPAPNGTYQIDKDEIVVKDGLIVSINGDKGANSNADENLADVTPADEAAETPADDAKEENDNAKAMAAMQTEIDSLKADVESLKSAIADDASSEQNMSADFTAQFTALNETLKTLMGTPAEFSRTTDNNIVKDSKDEKMFEFAKAFAEIKNKK